MLQRHQRNNLDQLIAFARDELDKDLLALKDSSSKAVHLAKTATTILDMYSNLSYPLIGLQVIKQNLTNTKHPHALQIQMVLDKAELFYLQSVKHDLGKLKADEKIQHLSPEDIKQYIEEINWKLGFERQSILNQSQEIGDNIDLMKFFEGVRNFQNWEQNLEKRTIQKLKKFSNSVENELTLRKGFLISKIEKIYQSGLQNRKKDVITSLEINSKMIDTLNVFSKIAMKNLSESFSLINVLTKCKNWTSKIKEVLSRAAFKIRKESIVSGFRNLVRVNKNVLNLVKTISKVQQRKAVVSQMHFMKKFSLKIYRNCQRVGRASQKMKKIMKRLGVKSIARAFGFSYFPLIQLLNRLYTSKIKLNYEQIIGYLKEKQALRDMVSYKLKGKILMSINRYESKPINIRKTFLDWYLKSHEQKYSKMVYNIWLNGSTSKFTFFMRLKNMIYDGRKQKIRQELKVFLMVLMQKMGDYYKFCQKGYISKWLERHRYCKKLNNLLIKLSNKVCKIDNNNLKQCLENIKTVSNHHRLLSLYLRKRISILQKNCKSGFDVWKAIPNIKKSKGRNKLLSFMRQKLDQLNADKKEVFDIFRRCKIKGKQMKIRFVTKVFTKDLVYLANFFNIWRRNKQQIKTTQENRLQFSNKQKQYALKTIQFELKHRQTLGLKEMITKVLMRTNFIKNRKQHTKKIFIKMLQISEIDNLKKSLAEFKQESLAGKRKKQNLVRALVNSNKTKQGQVLHIWNTGTQVKKQMEKRIILSQIFNKTNGLIKFTCDKAFETKFVYFYLQRFLNNYHNKVAFSFQCLRKLPRRINWNKKKITLQLTDKLRFLINRGKLECYEKFKDGKTQGQSKKKRAAVKLANYWELALRKIFQLYRDEANVLKNNERNYNLIKVMESFQQVQRKSFDYLIKGENIWKKKSDSFYKLNIKVTDRLRQAYKLWHNTAKDLTYLKKVTDERKKRVLQMFSIMYLRNEKHETRVCVNSFLKNKKIIELQTNFLRKLCDSQAGKVIKAMMIWKNLPKPKNKQVIAKASKFQRNLHNFAQKVFRTSFNRFKDEHYFGNDRKKLAIRTLVARSCNGIQKYFSIWKKNNKLITLFSQCHKIQLMFQNLIRVQQSSFKMLFEGNRSQKTTKSFDNINKWWKKQCLRLINIWRNKTFLLKQQDDKKRLNLLNLAVIQKDVQTRKVLHVIQKLKKRLTLRNVLSRSFIQTKKLNLHQSIQKIRTLPDRLAKKKADNKRKAVLGFLSKLESQIKDDKAKLFQILREERYQGNYKKMRSCDGYLKDKISQVHNILMLWLNMKRSDKQKRKEQKSQGFFDRLLQISHSNFSTVLESIRLTQMKKRCFDKLCNAMQIKKKGLFNIWRSKVKEIKIIKMLEDSNKKSILQKINKLISGTSQENVKKALKNFHLNFKIASVQVKFIQRLLQTKSGKVLQAFNKWKKIPNQNLMEKYKKGQKFFFKLEGMIKSKINEVHSCFKNNSDEGSTVKKQSVLQLLQITSSGIRRYYNRWIRITKRDHTLKQANSTMHSFDAIQHCAADVFKILFEDQRSTRVKTWAIEKLIKASGQNVDMYFKKWRDCIRTIKIAEEFEKTQKKTVLKIFSNVLGGAETIQIRQIIEKFHKNSSIARISKNFLNRLLKTKSGKVVQLFEVWKSIPDAKVAKKKKKAIKFESNLNKMSMKFMKFGFQPFKSSSHEARNRKRMCIQKLIRASMGEQKKKFILWRQIVREEKMLKHTHLFDSIFQHLQQNLTNNFGLMVKNCSEEVRIKKNLCRRLLNNASFVQHHAYLIWKEALQSDNVKIERTEARVRSNLQNLISVNEKFENRRLVQIIALFKKKQNFKLKLQADVVKQSKNRKAINFYDRISSFAHKNVSLFMNEVKKSHNELNFVNKNKSIQKSFENLNMTLAESLLIMFRSNKQTIILEKAINRIFDNFKISTQKAFNLWRQYKNVLNIQVKIGEQNKKSMLQILNRCLANQQGIKIPYVISKFEKNYKSLKLRKQILGKILQCKAGKVPLAFMIWKSLPNPGAKKIKQKAMKFQSGLARLINKNLRGTYEKFKEQNYQGSNKKKLAVRKLILVTMSGSNKYFNKWRKVTSESKITEKMLALTRFFENSVSALKTGMAIFDKARQQNERKVFAVQRICQNSHINLSWVVNQWRAVIKDTKCYNIASTLDKFQPHNFNLRLTKQAFMKIKSKADIEALRTYINSLWKWKMSNVEANYYAKFIKIFKESEQLLILSDCLNRKKQENLHFAFRRIICDGTNRHQRKYHITQKYLMRKVNNYFQRFKLNAMIQQISTWRNMYKSTIKGKKLIDLMEQFARKQLYESYHTIMKQQLSQKSCEKFLSKLEKFKQLMLKKALNKIETRAKSNKLDILFDVLHKITLKVQQQALDEMLKSTKVSSLVKSIQKLVERYQLRSGFSKIQQKSELKVKCKLAINIITLMQKQKLSKRVQLALFKFKRQYVKMTTLDNVLNKLSSKQDSNIKQFYKILRDGLDKKLLISRFKKGIAVKKILDKADTKALKRIFNLLKKKENKWLLESIKRFVIRSSIKSSQAVSLWRLKAFQTAALAEKK